jgi:hypothetical protein
MQLRLTHHFFDVLILSFASIIIFSTEVLAVRVELNGKNGSFGTVRLKTSPIEMQPLVFSIFKCEPLEKDSRIPGKNSCAKYAEQKNDFLNNPVTLAAGFYLFSFGGTYTELTSIEPNQNLELELKEIQVGARDQQRDFTVFQDATDLNQKARFAAAVFGGAEKLSNYTQFSDLCKLRKTHGVVYSHNEADELWAKKLCKIGGDNYKNEAELLRLSNEFFHIDENGTLTYLVGNKTTQSNVNEIDMFKAQEKDYQAEHLATDYYKLKPKEKDSVRNTPLFEKAVSNIDRKYEKLYWERTEREIHSEEVTLSVHTTSINSNKDFSVFVFPGTYGISYSEPNSHKGRLVQLGINVR